MVDIEKLVNSEPNKIVIHNEFYENTYTKIQMNVGTGYQETQKRLSSSQEWNLGKLWKSELIQTLKFMFGRPGFAIKEIE